MRQLIDTAPRDGRNIILEDEHEASGAFDVAHWSSESGQWIGTSGRPAKVRPTHWYPVPQLGYFDQSSDTSRRGHAGRRFAISLVAVTLIAATLAGVYFRWELGALVVRYAGIQGVVDPAPSGPRLAAKATMGAAPADGDLQVSGRIKAQQGSAGESAPVKQTPETPAPATRASPVNTPRQDVLARELADAPSPIARPKPREEPATAAQPPGETAAVMPDAGAPREAAAANEMQHRQVVEEQRARIDALASELAIARRDVDTKVAQLGKADDIVAQLERAAAFTAAQLQRERDRGAALAGDLEKVRSEFDKKLALSSKADEAAVQLSKAAETKMAELQRSFEQERQRAASLTSQLAALRSELDEKLALSSKVEEAAVQHGKAGEARAIELQQSLQQERQRAVALAGELAAARSELDNRVALSNKQDDEALQLRNVAEARATELQRERERTAALARDLDSMQRVLNGKIAPERVANSPAGQMYAIAEPAAREQPAVAEPQVNPEAARLIARAGTLLSQGNIGAARIVLERAGEMGSAEASFALAETYDPLVLAGWGTYGTQGDATKAREFYAKAMLGGIREAKDRLNVLRQ
ncbi:MAG TPA: hypothetical protein VGD13_15075 [Xanthobacteraceae bacterium]